MPSPVSRALRGAAATALTLLCTTGHAEGPNVRELMTRDEFDAAGLDKLTPEELNALNQWLVRYTVVDAPEVRRKDAVVQAEIEKADADGIRTRIVGEFRGWSGETIFQLENGQVWKQRLPGRWFYRADSPEVVLRKNTLGYWVLRVIEADRGIGVTRID